MVYKCLIFVLLGVVNVLDFFYIIIGNSIELGGLEFLVVLLLVEGFLEKVDCV